MHGAMLSTCLPATSLLRGERRLHQRTIVERTADERVGRQRAGHRGGSAAALPSGERQSFVDAKRHAYIVSTGEPQNFERRESARVSRGIARKLRVSGLLDPYARRAVDPRLDGIAGARERAAEDVESGADVADSAGCKCADSRPRGARNRFVHA